MAKTANTVNMAQKSQSKQKTAKGLTKSGDSFGIQGGVFKQWSLFNG